MKKKTFQIAFMPYAPIEEKFSLGQAEKMINDKEALEQLRKFFGRYFEFKRQKELKSHGEQLCQVIIISPQDFKIGQDMLSENQKIEITFSIEWKGASLLTKELFHLSVGTEPASP